MTKKTINAKLQWNPAPEYADEMINDLLAKGMDRDEIGSRLGVSKRTVYRTAEVGASYPIQVCLEDLTGRR